MSNSDIAFISKLESIVQERLKNPSDESYTAKLAAAGTKRIAQKLGEEGVELALAATSGDREEIMDEAADLVYHMLVLLANQDLSLADVAERLEARHAARSS
ncbi:MAG: phosphoribosyl-ATP diphosphatase [Gammaproteobacteria bacterium]|nr:phosphoribosyl-ATP diphosphatase [Gammaproteobacteria bacterium]MBT8111577.1 phosphoribosyl-ATP diphosphatase [Gammaproteobacteria bacterium]NND47845.1 phosphoribosyl-ATP diphosphatase [Woeseiaceae bacterium]NNL46275.1 phosphoribosyl-ATP diphosphatase [Woeseiaceae bacterium]